MRRHRALRVATPFGMGLLTGALTYLWLGKWAFVIGAYVTVISALLTACKTTRYFACPRCGSARSHRLRGLSRCSRCGTYID